MSKESYFYQRSILVYNLEQFDLTIAFEFT